MKIWLDDWRPMPEEFTHHVRNLREFQQLLASTDESIELMSFDYNLGSTLNLETYDHDLEPDGYEVIKWLVEHHLERYPKEVRSHSDSFMGRESILEFDRKVREHLLHE